MNSLPPLDEIDFEEVYHFLKNQPKKVLSEIKLKFKLIGKFSIPGSFDYYTAINFFQILHDMKFIDLKYGCETHNCGVLSNLNVKILI